MTKIACPKLVKMTFVIVLTFCCLSRLKGGKWLPNLNIICVLWWKWVLKSPNFDSTNLPKMAIYPEAKYLILLHLIQTGFSTNEIVTFSSIWHEIHRYFYFLFFFKVQQNYEIWKCLITAMKVCTLIVDVLTYDFLAALFFILMKTRIEDG